MLGTFKPRFLQRFTYHSRLDLSLVQPAVDHQVQEKCEGRLRPNENSVAEDKVVNGANRTRQSLDNDLYSCTSTGNLLTSFFDGKGHYLTMSK
jgi:hypothetical protein